MHRTCIVVPLCPRYFIQVPSGEFHSLHVQNSKMLMIYYKQRRFEAVSKSKSCVCLSAYSSFVRLLFLSFHSHIWARLCKARRGGGEGVFEIPLFSPIPNLQQQKEPENVRSIGHERGKETWMNCTNRVDSCIEIDKKSARNTTSHPLCTLVSARTEIEMKKTIDMASTTQQLHTALFGWLLHPLFEVGPTLFFLCTFVIYQLPTHSTFIHPTARWTSQFSEK